MFNVKNADIILYENKRYKSEQTGLECVSEYIEHGNLWLGNYKVALDSSFLQKNKITVIINCTTDIPYIFDSLFDHESNFCMIEAFRIPVEDSLLENDLYIMESYFPKVLEFIIQKLIIEQKNVLVHCRAGRQRSFIVILALLYYCIDNDIINIKILPNISDKAKLMRNILQYIRNIRPQVCSYGLRCNFKKSIENYFHLKF